MSTKKKWIQNWKFQFLYVLCVCGCVFTYNLQLTIIIISLFIIPCSLPIFVSYIVGFGTVCLFSDKLKAIHIEDPIFSYDKLSPFSVSSSSTPIHSILSKSGKKSLKRSHYFSWNLFFKLLIAIQNSN